MLAIYKATTNVGNQSKGENYNDKEIHNDIFNGYNDGGYDSGVGRLGCGSDEIIQ